jgi:hypothetical protein
MTAASRKQKSRERARDGVVCLTIETGRAELIATLEEVELLDGMSEQTRERLERGLEALLKLIYAARDAEAGKNMLQ